MAGEQTTTGNAANDEGDAATAMLARLEALTKSPYSYELHAANVQAASNDEERDEARNFMNQMVPMPEGLWIQWIQEKKQHAQAAPSLEASIEVLELYKRACQDYLSIRIHQDYAHFVVSLWYTARGYSYPAVLETGDDQMADPTQADKVNAGVFSADFVREELEQAVSPVVRWHLTDSNTVWKILHDFELDQLRRSPSPDAINRMHSIYLDRLAEPHIALAETHQLFSTFISTFANETYEASMVSAQQVYNKTRKVVDEREPAEDRLAKGGFSTGAYKRYIAWELDVKKPNFGLLRTLYERALPRNYHQADLWQGYGELLLRSARQKASTSTALQATAEDVQAVCTRMTKNLPASGVLAAFAIRTMESMGADEQVAAFAEAQTSRALETDLFDQNLEEFVQAVLAHADLLRHTAGPSNDAAPPEMLVDLLQKGIAKVKVITKDAGDPRLRLEMYLVRIYERAMAHEAIASFYVSLGKTYPGATTVTLARVEYEIKRDNIANARKLFLAAAKVRIDYPEYLFDAWVGFEHREGTSTTLEKALTTIKHEMTFVNARRVKAEQKAMAEAPQPGPTIATSVPGENLPQTESTMSQPAQPTLKRPLSEEVGADVHADPNPAGSAHKRMKEDHAPPVEMKRDRENSTVSVSNLASAVDEAALKRLFKDCGEIREIKLKVVDNDAVATIEFISREQVPSALTKDKKQLLGQEIAVHPDWQSTVYVTNFPESYDAADIQQLFQPHGSIFEVRWPSKRLKSTRRFVYVQYVSQSSAREALSLHNTEMPLGSGQRLQVKLSDPTRKLNRTDANANKKEIYVTGLPRFAKEADLKKLFESFGSVKGARVALDDEGNCKGFGFVDFDTEEAATAALSMNNHEYKKRRLAVVLADSKITQRSKPTNNGQARALDLANRSIRVKDLPKDVQEGLLHQYFEKLGPLEAVNVRSGQGEATVIFKEVSDAGRILLRAEPMQYEGQAITMTLEGPDAALPARGGASFISNPRGRGGATRAGRSRGSRLGIGAGRPTKSNVDTSTMAVDAQGGSKSEPDPPSNSGRKQADFKAMLLGKK